MAEALQNAAPHLNAANPQKKQKGPRRVCYVRSESKVQAPTGLRCVQLNADGVGFCREECGEFLLFHCSHISALITASGLFAWLDMMERFHFRYFLPPRRQKESDPVKLSDWCFQWIFMAAVVFSAHRCWLKIKVQPACSPLFFFSYVSRFVYFSADGKNWQMPF